MIGTVIFTIALCVAGYFLVKLLLKYLNKYLDKK